MNITHPTYRLGADFDGKLEALVDRILSDGMSSFAEEFQKIDAFLEKVANEPKERDAHELRSTEKVQYLLEAVSFKIYDRLNKEAFNRAAKTVIIIPNCLSLHNPKCKKKDLRWGDKCRLCTPTCQAFQVERLAKQYGAECVFSKRKLESQIKRFAKKAHEDIGVIGIGCLLMLAGGMRTAAEVSVPARGVPLDYCGCEHWNDQPFASSFQLARLEQILREKYEYQYQTTHD